MTANTIINAVLDHFDLPASEFIARNRDPRAVKARELCAYMLRTYTGLSWHQISAVMQRPAHTSALTMYQRVEARIMDDQPLRDEVGAILNRAAKAS
jgi:chromosomal replication initiation ATPase DnaA